MSVASARRESQSHALQNPHRVLISQWATELRSRNYTDAESSQQRQVLTVVHRNPLAAHTHRGRMFLE